jgi:hypothetical protein
VRLLNALTILAHAYFLKFEKTQYRGQGKQYWGFLNVNDLVLGGLGIIYALARLIDH